MGEGDVERVPEEHVEAEKLGEDERLPVPDVEKVGEGVVMPVVGMGEELGVKVTVRDTVTLGVSEGNPVVGRALEEMEEQGEEEIEGLEVELVDGLTDCPAVVIKQEKMKRMVQDLNDLAPVVGMGTIGRPWEAQGGGGLSIPTATVDFGGRKSPSYNVVYATLLRTKQRTLALRQYSGPSIFSILVLG